MEEQNRSGQAALRRGRFSISNQIYLITATTRERAPLFADWQLGRVVVKALRQHQHVADTLCYVVMPDHLHWLMRLKPSYSLAQAVGWVKGSSSYAIGQLIGTAGAIWQKGFHDRALRSEEELLPTARYVIANPLRAGLVEKLVDYPLWDAVWLEASNGEISSL